MLKDHAIFERGAAENGLHEHGQREKDDEAEAVRRARSPTILGLRLTFVTKTRSSGREAGDKDLQTRLVSSPRQALYTRLMYRREQFKSSESICHRRP
ncbi:hypothetical protein MRB53_037007 [Persea americana]|nr:hypothetical protein MRB53_037007 [Persea americana]